MGGRYSKGFITIIRNLCQEKKKAEAGWFVGGASAIRCLMNGANPKRRKAPQSKEPLSRLRKRSPRAAAYSEASRAFCRGIAGNGYNATI